MPGEDSITLRKEYDLRRPSYDRLMNIVALVIQTSLEKKGIKIHSTKKRVKDFESFLEKIDRKSYEDAFKQCTDLAGFRVICLFKSQIKDIMEIIRNEFEVIEITDKKSTKKFDQFGYLSVHMIIKMPKERLRFTEYKDLGNLVCEIQIRTLLQEAWAEIEHHLNYKAAKEQKNEALVRKMFSLAGMFEVADSSFEDINNGFSVLVEKELENKEEITALNLYKFSKEKFSWFEEEWDKSQERRFVKLSQEVKTLHLKFAQLTVLLDKYKSDIDAASKKDGVCNLIRYALALEFGKKFDLIIGIKGYSESVKKEFLKIKDKLPN
ncbi:MAG: hypothetical protein ABIJ34_02070 [archaeon]